jgi:hypothetical protein
MIHPQTPQGGLLFKIDKEEDKDKERKVSSYIEKNNMIIQYIRIAFRNIKRHAAYSALNISGLAIGMTSSILIFLWVYDECSYDKCFKNAEVLFRVIEDQHLQEGKGSLIVPTASVLAAALKSEYPEIIRATRLCPSPLTLKIGDEYFEEMVTSADKDFLKMFGVRFILGDINTAFDNPHNIVMTEETAMTPHICSDSGHACLAILLGEEKGVLKMKLETANMSQPGAQILYSTHAPLLREKTLRR